MQYLKSREKARMHQGRFRVLETHRNVTSQSKVGVLVNSTWNQTGYVTLRTKHMGESVGEGRSGLDGSEMDFTDSISAWCVISVFIRALKKG